MPAQFSKRTIFIVALVFFVFALIAPLLIKSNGQSTDPKPSNVSEADPALKRSTATFDPKADKVLRAFADHMTSLSAYSVDITAHMTFLTRGIRHKKTEMYSLTVAKPDRLALVLKKGLRGTTLVNNGTVTLFFDPLLHQYLTRKSPENLNAFFHSKNELGNMLDQTVPFINVLAVSDPYKALSGSFTAAHYIGAEEIDQIPCDHLQLIQFQPQMKVTWNIWIRSGSEPVLIRIAPDLSNTSNNPQFPYDSMTLRWDFTDWRRQSDLPAERFSLRLTVPAERVDTFYLPNTSTVHPLVGKAAPNFSLKLLNGKKVTLAQHKGKDVVILDFWATWCQPCRIGMPILDKIASQYKNKGVVLYAMNTESIQNAPTSRLRAFLKSSNLNVTVARDNYGSTAAHYYGSESYPIPMTVIIDKEGIVRNYYEGITANYEQDLKKEIDEILSGKKPKKPTQDLVIRSVGFLPEPLQAGKKLSLKYVLANEGSDPIQAGTCNVLLLIDEQQTYVTALAQTIPPNGQHTFEVPADIWQIEIAKPGRHTYTFVVDFYNQLKEINENNNEKKGSFRIPAL